MQRIGARRVRAAPTLAALLPWLAGCWWLVPEPGPGEWSLRSGTIADFQPHHVAGLYENDGMARLLMECGGGPIAFRISSGRDLAFMDLAGFPVRYRLDGNPLVATTVVSDGAYLWFRHPGAAGGEDPMVARIEGARQLAVRIDWGPADRQTMRFDVSRAAAAMAWLRRECAQER